MLYSDNFHTSIEKLSYSSIKITFPVHLISFLSQIYLSRIDALKIPWEKVFIARHSTVYNLFDNGNLRLWFPVQKYRSSGKFKKFMDTSFGKTKPRAASIPPWSFAIISSTQQSLISRNWRCTRSSATDNGKTCFRLWHLAALTVNRFRNRIFPWGSLFHKCFSFGKFSKDISQWNVLLSLIATLLPYVYAINFIYNFQCHTVPQIQWFQDL